MGCIEACEDKRSVLFVEYILETREVDDFIGKFVVPRANEIRMKSIELCI